MKKLKEIIKAGYTFNSSYNSSTNTYLIEISNEERYVSLETSSLKEGINELFNLLSINEL